MSDVSRSFISFTPVVDVSFLDPNHLVFLTNGERDTAQYVEWDTGRVDLYFVEDSRSLNAALISKGVPAHTSILLKMY